MVEYKSKRVEVSGIEDKRQITATFAASLTGPFYQCSLFIKVKPANVTPLLIFPTIGTSPTHLTTGAMKVL